MNLWKKFSYREKGKSFKENFLVNPVSAQNNPALAGELLLWNKKKKKLEIKRIKIGRAHV